MSYMHYSSPHSWYTCRVHLILIDLIILIIIFIGNLLKLFPTRSWLGYMAASYITVACEQHISPLNNGDRDSPETPY
jgi:hypothetical protein